METLNADLTKKCGICVLGEWEHGSIGVCWAGVKARESLESMKSSEAKIESWYMIYKTGEKKIES